MKKKNINMYMASVVFLTVLVGLAHGGWSEVSKLVDPNGADYDYFGVSVSVSGDYAIVGACGEANYRGSAYLFKRDGSSWIEQAKLIASDGATEDVFGISVSISGEYAIVGASGDNAGIGSAYIFKRDVISWAQQTKLTASDGAAEDMFGSSVSISGDYAVVGSYCDDDNGSDSGSAYIFNRDKDTWVQQDKLTALDGTLYDYFGNSVCIAGDYAIVGAYSDDGSQDDSGSAYIFKRDATAWTQQAKLNASDGGGEDLFGISVCLDGDYAIVGACGSDPGIGSAYIFKRERAAWGEQVKLTAGDGAFEDYFGASVGIDGSVAVVGSYGDDAYRGSAYIFEKLCPSADLTGDCFVDIDDFMVMAGQWLTGEN